MDIFIKAANRAYPLSTVLEHSAVEQYLLEYGFKQCLADAAAGKSGQEALAAIQARFDRLASGDVPKRGDRADSLEAATRKIYSDWMRGQLGLKAKDATDRAKTTDGREKALGVYITHLLIKATGRQEREWTDADKARHEKGMADAREKLDGRIKTLLAEMSAKVSLGIDMGEEEE